MAYDARYLALDRERLPGERRPREQAPRRGRSECPAKKPLLQTGCTSQVGGSRQSRSNEEGNREEEPVGSASSITIIYMIMCDERLTAITIVVPGQQLRFRWLPAGNSAFASGFSAQREQTEASHS
jgi:hypothetical protein